MEVALQKVTLLKKKSVLYEQEGEKFTEVPYCDVAPLWERFFFFPESTSIITDLQVI
jgi:hypothetical protein